MLYPILNPRQKYIFLTALGSKDDFIPRNSDFSAQKPIKETKSLHSPIKKINFLKKINAKRNNKIIFKA